MAGVLVAPGQTTLSTFYFLRAPILTGFMKSHEGEARKLTSVKER